MYTAHAYSRKISSSDGGVIVECLLVLPFLLLVFGGILGLGRAYAQLTWVANSSYEVALSGAGNAQGPMGETAAQTRNTLLGQLPYYNLVSAPSIGAPLYGHFDPATEPLLKNTVLVRLNAELPLLFSRWVTTFHVDTVLPILVLGGGTAGDLTRFQNPGCLYNCNGDVISISTGVCCSNPDDCPQACS